MIRHAWSILCEKVVTDKDSNNLTLSVLEQIEFRYSSEDDIPDDKLRIVVPISGSIVSLWYKDVDV